MAMKIAQASILREIIFKNNKTAGINLTYRRSSLLNYAFVCSLIATSETCSAAGRFYRILMRRSAEYETGYDEPAHIHHRRPAQCMPVRLGPVSVPDRFHIAFAPVSTKLRTFCFYLKWSKWFFVLFLCARLTFNFFFWKSTVAGAWIMPLLLLLLLLLQTLTFEVQ